MLRPGRVSSLAHSIVRPKTFRGARKSSQFTSQASKPLVSLNGRFGKSTSLALTAYRPLSTSLQRWAIAPPKHPETPYDHIDKKHEKDVGKSELEPHPEEVSMDSSVHQVFQEKGVPETEKDEDMLAGVYSDVKTIKETFALNEVPREALYVGLAGVIPYLATSASTVYLAWDINHAALEGQGFLLSGQTAELLLHIIEPLQIGWGAVIISFLGAIHWGLEWAKYGGVQGYRRYAYGVVAPAVAWPTLLFPIEYALISQFTAFTFLYFADARACVRGWTPHCEAHLRPTYPTAKLQQYLRTLSLPSTFPHHGFALDYNELRTLQQHHLSTYPFENLSLHYSTTHTVSLDTDALFEKFVEKGCGRGGYCMENNGFFGTVLRSMG
ncbi:MAG: hypothetical protein Q9180_002911, partial [Flavoplaca navasiana]